MGVYGSIHQSTAFKVDGPEDWPSPFVAESDQVGQGLQMNLVSHAGTKVARDSLVSHHQLDLSHWIEWDFGEGADQGGIKVCRQAVCFHIELSWERQSGDLPCTILVAFDMMNLRGGWS